jgi:hypothetical protein
MQGGVPWFGSRASSLISSLRGMPESPRGAIFKYIYSQPISIIIMTKLILFLFLFFIVVVGGCTDKTDGGDVLSDGKEDGINLPISSRDFYLGVVPTPKSLPETTWDDIVDAYKEAGDIAEVTMVWTGKNIGQFERLKENQVMTALRVYGLKTILTLSFATIKEVPGEGLVLVIDAPEGFEASLSDHEFRSQWVNEAKMIAQEFKPEYFSLGNEINDYFYLHPEDIDSYMSLFVEAYSEIKEASPGTKVFVVFSYTHLIDNNQWDLLERFNSKVDLIGLTTYPWKHFDDPGDIPVDYYTRLSQHTSRPIAFTEIGWISSEERGSSEGEQADYLMRFLELTKDMDIEMINWLFLHEPELTGIVASVTSPETSTISLKNRDGSKKGVYDVWVRLKDVTNY